MPANWWIAKAVLNGDLILKDEIKMPSSLSIEEVMDGVILTAYGLRQWLMAAPGAELTISIQQIQTPWWWE